MSDQREVVVREVGPRDGLQSLSSCVPLDVKARLITDLAAAGVRRVEAGAFVSPRAVPQMADTAAVFEAVRHARNIAKEALVVERRGASCALDAGVDAIVVVVATTESFSQANTRMSIDAAIAEVAEIVRAAADRGCPVVADVATSFGCAYEGPVETGAVLQVVDRLAAIGIVEITLADTTGMAAPPDVEMLVAAAHARFGQDVTIGLHFHNTRGLGLANVWTGLEAGVRLFDSSLGGLGGCPFSPGATGNIATEDLVHLLAVSGYETGIDLRTLIEVTRRLEGELEITLPGQVLRAGPRWELKARRLDQR